MNGNTNIEYLKIQIKKALQTISNNNESDLSLLNFDNIRFYLKIDQDEKQPPKTTIDDIMHHWILPSKIDIPLTINEVCDTLTTIKNEIPLYAKIFVIDLNKTYSVITSKRFRKRKEVEQYHISSDFTPFRVD